MKKVLFSLGLGVALMNVAFAENSLLDNMPRVKEIMQKMRENPAVQECMKKGSMEEKKACFKDLMEKARQNMN